MEHWIWIRETGEVRRARDLAELNAWRAQNSTQLVETRVCVARVSTIFLTSSHNFLGSGPPLLWETLVFGGPMDGAGDRYATQEEALAGHADLVAQVRAAFRANNGPRGYVIVP